jgi:hypothetical protein
MENRDAFVVDRESTQAHGAHARAAALIHRLPMPHAQEAFFGSVYGWMNSVSGLCESRCP